MRRRVALIQLALGRMTETILARTHRGDQVALLEHERVRFTGQAAPFVGKAEVELVDRVGAPLCYVPRDKIAAAST